VRAEQDQGKKACQVHGMPRLNLNRSHISREKGFASLLRVFEGEKYKRKGKRASSRGFNLPSVIVVKGKVLSRVHLEKGRVLSPGFRRNRQGKRGKFSLDANGGSGGPRSMQ